MTADSAPPGASETPASAVPGRRVSSRKLLKPFPMACAALAAVLAMVLAVVALWGSPRDGLPEVFLAMTPFPGNPSQASPALPAVQSVRSVLGHVVADPRIIEESALGPLPVMGEGGRAASTVYAQAFDRADKRPRVAIVIGGLGISVRNTMLALARLPEPVTLAFSPFTKDAQALVDKARAAGHEILLEVPMEPFDFPESDPGPHALMVGASVEENINRLEWALSRFTGYVGITHELGGRFLGEMSAIEPVLAATAKRGLLFFDNGANSTSVAMTAARHVQALMATGTLTLDGVQSAAAIDARLSELEGEASRDGFAVGVGSPHPITIARIAAWAESAEARGFAIAPISALARLTPEPPAVPVAERGNRAKRKTASAR